MSKVAIISAKGDKIVIHAAGCKHLAKKDAWGHSVEENFAISTWSGKGSVEAWVAEVIACADGEDFNWKATYANCAK